MLNFLMLLILGLELNASALYWILWGIGFAIESIDLLNSIYFETDNEEDNDR